MHGVHPVRFRSPLPMPMTTKAEDRPQIGELAKATKPQKHNILSA